MKHVPQTRRGWITVALLTIGGFLLIISLFSLFRNPKDREYQILMTSGAAGTSRHKIAEYFADEGDSRKLDVKIRDTIGSIEALDLVENGEIDIALIQGGLRLRDRPHVRQVAALYLEPLHLLVRSELYAACQENLKALAGKRIQVGQPGSGTHLLSTAVLRFAGLGPQQQIDDGGYVATSMSAQDILTRLNALQQASEEEASVVRAELPDALFTIATLPSLLARRLVTVGAYRVVSSGFGEAFSLVSIDEVTGDDDEIEQLFLQTTEIPAQTYSVAPAVPDASCETIGTRLLIIAHEDVNAEAIRRILEMIYEGPFNKVFHPPDVDEQLAEYRLHQGTLSYRDHRRPLLWSEAIERIQKLAAVLGTLVGGIFACYGYWRWRQTLRFRAYFSEVAEIESRARESRNFGDPHRGKALVDDLEEELDELRIRAMEDFSSGYLRGEGVINALLSHISQTRHSIPRLILEEQSRNDKAAADGIEHASTDES